MDVISANGTTLTIYWLRKAPRYVGDFRTYVWRKYGLWPQLDYVRVMILPSRPQDTTGRKLVGVTESKGAVDMFQEEYKSAKARLRAQDREAIGAHVILLTAIFSSIRDSTMHVLEQISKELSDMVCR